MAAPIAFANSLHNLNALLLGTVEFSFAETPFLTDSTAMIAAARIAGFRDFGNVTGFSINPTVTKKEHSGSYRGTTRLDKSVVTGSSLTYKLTMDEMTYQNIQLVLMGAAGAKVNQPALTTTTAEALDFTVTPGKFGVWYPITINGVRVYNITQCVATITAGAVLVDGTDYVIDALNGRIMFKSNATTIAALVTVPKVITLTTVTADAHVMYSTAPMGTTKRVGIGNMIMFDDMSATPIPFEHVDFGCEITPEGSTDFGGGDFGKFSVNVIMTLPVGTVRVRELSGGTVVA